jgi:DNA-binding transcriptional LysR family regulator
VDVHLRDLRYFVAVAEELHFTRAAQRLFVSQPALSRQIAKLEQDLRVILLVRDRRHVRLTAAGQCLLDGTRVLLASWDETRRTVADAAATASSNLRVGIQTSIGRGILATIRESLERTHPTWTLTIVQVRWDDPAVGLTRHDTDIALVWLPAPEPELLRWVVVATEPRHVALPLGHRLAKRRRIVLADLDEEPFIALPEQTGALRSFWLAENQRSRPAIIGTIAYTAEETFEAVAAGQGVALVAKGNAELYNHDAVISRPVTDLGPAELALAWRHDDHREIVRAAVMAVSQKTSRASRITASDTVRAAGAAQRRRPAAPPAPAA